MNKKHVAIEIMPRFLWVIEGFTLFILHSIVGEKPVTTNNNIYLLLGTLITIFGVFYLVTTFYKLAKPMFTKELVTDGPYGYVRHPMYVSMYVLLVGIGILFFSQLWFAILLIFIPLWYFDCLLEESQMIDLHGDKYRDYKKRVGMFFPLKL